MNTKSIKKRVQHLFKSAFFTLLTCSITSIVGVVLVNVLYQANHFRAERENLMDECQSTQPFMLEYPPSNEMTPYQPVVLKVKPGFYITPKNVEYDQDLRMPIGWPGGVTTEWNWVAFPQISNYEVHVEKAPNGENILTQQQQLESDLRNVTTIEEIENRKIPIPWIVNGNVTLNFKYKHQDCPYEKEGQKIWRVVEE